MALLYMVLQSRLGFHTFHIYDGAECDVSCVA